MTAAVFDHLLMTEPSTSLNVCTSSAPPADWLSTSRSNSSSNSLPAVCQYFIFVINGLVAGSICVLGLIGNLAAVIVLRKDSKTPVASFQLMALAVADNLFLALWFIHYSLRFVLRFAGGPVPPVLTYVRVTTFAVLYTAQTWTIWLTVAIAFTRYMAVCWPYVALRFHNINRVRLQIAVVTALAILYNLPR